MNPPAAATPPEGLARHPYRALFPLGWFLSLWALAPWVLFWMQTGVAYPVLTHSLILIEGALTTFAAGFLFTMFPRRLDAPAPNRLQLGLILTIPIAHAFLAWRQEFVWAHALFAVVALMLMEFSATRVFGSRGARTGPAAFLWVPFGFVCGAAGAILQAIGLFSPGTLPAELLRFGHLLLTQGLFLSLVMGVGAMFVPLTSHKEASKDVTLTEDPNRRRLGHACGAAGLLLGFLLEAFGSPQLGRLTAAISILLVLILAARFHRLPAVAGTQRRLIWIATWCLPLGLAIAAAFPERPHLGLHLVFLGGLFLLTLSVALHVGLAHAGGQELVQRPVFSIRLFGALTFAALACRLIAEYAVAERFGWLALAAALAMLALVPWALLILPRLLPLLMPPSPRTGSSGPAGRAEEV